MGARQTTDDELDALGDAIERHPPGIGRGCNLCAAATHRADQAEARVAELAAALRCAVGVADALYEQQAMADESQRPALEAARAVLARAPAAAAEQVAAMAAAADVLRAVQYSGPYDKCVGCGAYAGLEENEPCKPECPVYAALARLDAAGGTP